MKTHPLKHSLLLVLVSLGVSAIPTQATTIYTNQATFLAATQPGYYLETFNSLPQFTQLASPLNFSSNGFTYNATAPTAGFFNIGPSGDTWLSTSTNSILLFLISRATTSHPLAVSSF